MISWLLGWEWARGGDMLEGPWLPDGIYTGCFTAQAPVFYRSTHDVSPHGFKFLERKVFHLYGTQSGYHPQNPTR